MKLVFNSKGEEIRAEYYPQKTKKDQGGRLISTKRPFILPVEDKNRCFFTYYNKYKSQRELLGQEYLHEDSPFFLTPKMPSLWIRSNERLFKPEQLRSQGFNLILYNAFIEAGLSVKGRKITNTSARVLGFHTQENAGIDAVSGQVFTGHIAPMSAAFYRRNNYDMSSKVGAALARCVTSSEAIVPESAGILLTKNLPLNNVF